MGSWKILRTSVLRAFGNNGKRNTPKTPPKTQYIPLPVEILIIIVNFLQKSPAALHALALSSRVLYQIALPLLYQHVTLTSRRSAQGFFTAVDLHPELRQRIRTLRTAWDRVYEVSSNGDIFFTPVPKPDAGILLSRRSRYSHTTDDMLGELATQQLQLLADCPPNMKSLAIGLRLYEYDAELREFPTITPVLRQLSLTKLSLNCKLRHVDGLSAILRTQPLLKHLELPMVLDIAPILPTDIPLLETFVGEAWAALRIIRGRPVKKLTMLYKVSPGSAEFLFPALAPEPENPLQVEELTLQAAQYTASINFGRVGIMSLIAGSLPSVRSLKITVTFEGDEDELPLLFKDFFQSMPLHISRMTKLESLNLAKTCILSSSPFGLNLRFQQPADAAYLKDDLVVEELLNTWVDQCPTLNQVIMPDSSLWRWSQSGVWRKCGQYVQNSGACTIFDTL